MTRIARRAAAVVAACVVAVALTGCGAGLEAQTNQPYSPSIGSYTTIGPITITNTVVVGSGPAGISELFADFVTSGAPDVLTGIQVTKASAITLPDGPIPIVQYTQVSLGPKGTRIFLHDFAGKDGDVVVVTFDFRDAGSVNVDALVATTENLITGS